MTAQNVVFLFVLVLGAGFFALNVQRLVSYLQIGFAEDRTDHPLVRLKNVLVIGIAQKKIFRDPVAGPMHALIFWGFMVLTAGTVEILIAGVFPSFSFASFLPDADLRRILRIAGHLRAARHRGGGLRALPAPRAASEASRG